jgi:hypothetical protein
VFRFAMFTVWMVSYPVSDPSLSLEAFTTFSGGKMEITEGHVLVVAGEQRCLFKLKTKQRRTMIEKFMTGRSSDVVRIQGFAASEKHDDFLNAWSAGALISFGPKRELLCVQVQKTGCERKRRVVLQSGVYVLRLEGRAAPRYYVGKSDDIGRRIEQHNDGGGAAFTKNESFSCFHPTTTGMRAFAFWCVN